MVSKAEIWSQEEEKLASEEICQANKELERESKRKQDDIYRRNRNNLNDLAIISQNFKLVIEEAKKCADVVYEKFCEVWEKQGKPKTPEFLRSVILPRVWGAIDRRISNDRDNLQRMALRMSINDLVMRPLLADLQRKGEYLKRDEWQKRIEIEAGKIELYHQNLKVPMDHAVTRIHGGESQNSIFGTGNISKTKKKVSGRQKPSAEARRAAIRNAMLDRKEGAENFCKRLDSENVALPAGWKEEHQIAKWMDAWREGKIAGGEKLRNKLEKMLSHDKDIISKRDPNLCNDSA